MKTCNNCFWVMKYFPNAMTGRCWKHNKSVFLTFYCEGWMDINWINNNKLKKGDKL